MRAVQAILLFLCVFFVVPAYSEDMVVTYRSAESPTDRRYEYDNELLRLALEKTRGTWGGYRLVPSPVMNFSRAEVMLKSGVLENPMFKISASNDLCLEYPYVPFPVDLGIVGYRMFFTTDRTSVELAAVRSLEQLKKFSIGQGFGWLDTSILASAGFEVVTTPVYESLFTMVALGRFDLFSRGVNEIEMEYAAHKDIPHFVLNTDVGLYYPLPRFFFTDAGGKVAAKRVYEGLEKAYRDGSLKALWEAKYRSSLNFCRVAKVKFFEVKNPFIEKVDGSYKQFMVKM